MRDAGKVGGGHQGAYTISGGEAYLAASTECFASCGWQGGSLGEKGASCRFKQEKRTFQRGVGVVVVEWGVEVVGGREGILSSISLWFRPETKLFEFCPEI